MTRDNLFACINAENMIRFLLGVSNVIYRRAATTRIWRRLRLCVAPDSRLPTAKTNRRRGELGQRLFARRNSGHFPLGCHQSPQLDHDHVECACRTTTKKVDIHEPRRRLCIFYRRLECSGDSKGPTKNFAAALVEPSSCWVVMELVKFWKGGDLARPKV